MTRYQQAFRELREADEQGVSAAAAVKLAFEWGIAKLYEMRDAKLDLFGAGLTVGQRLEVIRRRTQTTVPGSQDLLDMWHDKVVLAAWKWVLESLLTSACEESLPCMVSL